MEELKYCPFCGKEAKLMHGYHGVEKMSYVKCTHCAARTAEFEISTEYAADVIAVEAWNKRVDP